MTDVPRMQRRREKPGTERQTAPRLTNEMQQYVDPAEEAMSRNPNISPPLTFRGQRVESARS